MKGPIEVAVVEPRSGLRTVAAVGADPEIGSNAITPRSDGRPPAAFGAARAE